MNVNLSNSDQSLHQTKPVETSGAAEPAQSAILTKADIALLHKALGQGLSGFARQGDIVELHKRIGEKLESLPAELTTLDSVHETRLLTRIEEMEKSLNGLEAALRIELPPLLIQTITETAQDGNPRRRGRVDSFLLLLAMVIGGVMFGAWYHQPLLDLAARLPEFLSY